MTKGASVSTITASTSSSGASREPFRYPIPKPLIEGLRARDCVAFLGAGFSKPVGMPLWIPLLKHLAKVLKNHPDHPDLIKYAKGCIERGELARAASALSRADSAHQIDPELQGLFGSERFSKSRDAAAREEMRRRLESLTSLPWAGYITTNYDTLLSDYFASLNRPVANICHNPSDNLGRAIKRSSRPFLIHLHGNVKAGGLVLTEEDYDDVYLDSSSVQQFLRAILLRYTLVFIGTQVEDKFVEMRRQIQLLYNDRRSGGGKAPAMPPEYVLLPYPDESLRGAYLRDTNVFTVIYYANKSGNHEGLVPRLREAKKSLSDKKNGARDDEVVKRLLTLVKKHENGITWSPLVVEFWAEHATYIRGRGNLNNHEIYYCLFYLSQNHLIEISEENGEEVFRPLKR